MKNTIKYISISVACSALAFSAGFIFTTARNNTRLTDANALLNKRLIKYDRNTECLRQNYIYSNRHIADSVGIVADISGSETQLAESDSVTLICRISEQHCSSCTGYAVRLAKETGCKNVIYMANDTRKRSLQNLAMSFDIGDSQIFGTGQHLSDADYLMFPYFLFVDKGNRIKAIYIPFEANDEPDKEMLRLMLDRLNKG